MAAIGEAPSQLPSDGRQSETALRVARGARRLLRSLDFVTIQELPLANGRRADIVGVTRKSRVIIVEIKSSIADFRADNKWPDYREHCDELLFAIPEDVPADIMPPDAGLMIADAYGASIVRAGPEHKMAPATRREMLLRFARAAADRLHRLEDVEWRFVDQ